MREHSVQAALRTIAERPRTSRARKAKMQGTGCTVVLWLFDPAKGQSPSPRGDAWCLYKSVSITLHEMRPLLRP